MLSLTITTKKHFYFSVSTSIDLDFNEKDKFSKICMITGNAIYINFKIKACFVSVSTT